MGPLALLLLLLPLRIVGPVGEVGLEVHAVAYKLTEREGEFQALILMC